MLSLEVVSQNASISLTGIHPLGCRGLFCRNSIPTFWKFCASNFLFFYRSLLLCLFVFFLSPAVLSSAVFLPPLLILLPFFKKFFKCSLPVAWPLAHDPPCLCEMLRPTINHRVAFRDAFPMAFSWAHCVQASYLHCLQFLLLDDCHLSLCGPCLPANCI